MVDNKNTLESELNYTPQELKFGTSGRRGLVKDLSQLEIYINVLGELRYLQTLKKEQGGIVNGQPFYVGTDLRPSSTEFVPEQGNRGELTQTVLQAIADAGMNPVFLGALPTPALTFYALQRGCGSIMVTGSHIPFDRNGYKTNTAMGELLKEHEAPIAQSVAQVRAELYRQSYGDSKFNEAGFFKTEDAKLPPVKETADAEYIARYTSFFAPNALEGMKVLVYEHSAVGRDILRNILERLGALVVAAGRSEQFVPIDTENIGAEQLTFIQKLADTHTASGARFDAVVSVDGDSDRPLLLGVEPESGKVRFFGGDLVGMIVAEYLQADAVVVPISCNDAIDRGPLASRLEPKTPIGSPFVIAGMQAAVARGKKAVCGWEANGGFLLGSDLDRNGKHLKALPTRDAVLPIVCTLRSAHEKHLSLPALFATLPQRWSRAALLKNFPRPLALKIVSRFSPADSTTKDIDFSGNNRSQATLALREDLSQFFPASSGFGKISKLNYLDGVRITFDNGEIVHIRPSGNADELRVYAVADDRERAEELAALGIAEPDGILRQMEKSVRADSA